MLLILMFIFIWWKSKGGLAKPFHYTPMDLDNNVYLYVIKIGFFNISHLRCVNINHDLIAALVEWWRWETQTFNFLVR
jgi:hypothetical protein